MAGGLHLFASPLSTEGYRFVLPSSAIEVLGSLRHFFVEDIRHTRRFFSALGCFKDIRALACFPMGKHTNAERLLVAFEQLAVDNRPIGLLSTAGLPIIADPGANLVAAAQQQGLRIRIYGMASAPLQALVGSGFGAQRFAFHGYLPIATNDCHRRLKELAAAAQHTPQIFIEAPHRNQQLLAHMLAALPPNQLLCIASALDHPSRAMLRTLSLAEWKHQQPSLHKVPTTFVLGCFPRK